MEKAELWVLGDEISHYVRIDKDPPQVLFSPIHALVTPYTGCAEEHTHPQMTLRARHRTILQQVCSPRQVASQVMPVAWVHRTCFRLHE